MSGEQWWYRIDEVHGFIQDQDWATPGRYLIDKRSADEEGRTRTLTHTRKAAA